MEVQQYKKPYVDEYCRGEVQKTRNKRNKKKNLKIQVTMYPVYTSKQFIYLHTVVQNDVSSRVVDE